LITDTYLSNTERFGTNNYLLVTRNYLTVSVNEEKIEEENSYD